LPKDCGFVIEPEQLDENKPHLKPSDLEDIALIFDRIRIFNRKKEEVLGTPIQKQKRLISKGSTKQID
jgi:hypothetical protein